MKKGTKTDMINFIEELVKKQKHTRTLSGKNISPSYTFKDKNGDAISGEEGQRPIGAEYFKETLYTDLQHPSLQTFHYQPDS